MKLSDTALIVLGNAANREDRMVPRRPKSPPIVDINACRALVKAEFLESVALPHIARPDLVTTGKQDDGFMGFRITDAGFRAINQNPPGVTPETTATDAPTAPHAPTDDAVAQEAAAVADALDAAPVAPTAADAPTRTKTSLRDAAAAVLAAWDDQDNRDTDIIGALDAPMESLRALLATPVARAATTDAPCKPREGTKQQAVLTMLRRAEGATGAQVMEATGWASHTVRGFFAGLKKKGIPVEVLERVKHTGPDKQGAKGSYTIYHVATAA